MARNSAKLDALYAVFDKHDVPIDRDGIWEVQGTPVVKHKDVERLGAALKVQYDAPTIIRAERDEAVILVVGRIGDRMEWSIGEALISKDGQGGNYRVSGKQASYVWAMAEKRAKDRVILKLAELHGDAYSEDEMSGDEKEEERRSSGSSSRGQAEKVDNVVPLKTKDKATDGEKPAGDGSEITDEQLVGYLKADIDKLETVNAVTDYMLHKDTERDLKTLPKGMADEVREYAKSRLKDLGWPGKGSKKGA